MKVRQLLKLTALDRFIDKRISRSDPILKMKIVPREINHFNGNKEMTMTFKPTIGNIYMFRIELIRRTLFLEAENSQRVRWG